MLLCITVTVLSHKNSTNSQFVCRPQDHRVLDWEGEVGIETVRQHSLPIYIST